MALMAIDVCSEISSPGISPRISFSHDLNNNNNNNNNVEDDGQQCISRLDSSLLDSNSSSDNFDFDFGGCSFFQELSSADELFSNGRLVPMQIKKQINVNVITATTTQTHHQPLPCPSHHHQGSADHQNKMRLKELLSMSDLDEDPDDDETTTTTTTKPAASSKSFWQFKRSSSLNCESTRSKNLIRSSLQFLSRSNSTGSAPNPKPTTREPQKQNLRRQPSVSRKSSSSSSSSSSNSSSSNNRYYFYYNNNPSTQKPPLRKCGSYNGNGVRISPVLNIPPPYISINATVSLFSFGSIFCNGKVKKKNR